MIPGDAFFVEQAAHNLRRRAWTDRVGRRRAAAFAPPEWPPSRGPTPHPKRH